jgi:cysteine-rich repeat protein
MSIAHGIRSAAVVIAAVLALPYTGPAFAQCVGDCDEDNVVLINELITGVNIALDSAPLTSCPSFDPNDSGVVQINELILGVGNALNGCPPIDTPTSTPIVGEPTATQTIGETTPTATHTNTASPTVPATSTPTPLPLVCGDGIVNLTGGETCDDGNTLDGDSCPADCRIESCQASGERQSAQVIFTTDDPELQIVALTVFVKYPDGVVDVPGLAGDPAVIANVTSEVFAVTPTDYNYGTTIVLIDPFQGGYPSGTVAASITYDRCQGAGAPQPGDFSCQVTDAVDTNVNTVTDQVSCSVALL